MSSTHSSLRPIHPLLAAILGLCYYLLLLQRTFAILHSGQKLSFGTVFRSMKKSFS
jgi:hypothetical protein